MRNYLNKQGGWSRPFAILNWVRPNPPQTQLNSRSSTQVWFLIACYTSKICNLIKMNFLSLFLFLSSFMFSNINIFLNDVKSVKKYYTFFFNTIDLKS